MGGHLLVGAVDPRFVPAGGGDAGLEIVADELGGGTAIEGESVDVTADPVGQSLGPAGLGVGVVGGAQGRDEDLGWADLAGHRDHHVHGLTGIVDEQLVAGDMGLAHGGRHPPAPVGVEVAEPAVAVSVGMPPAILLPEQHQGDAGAAQLGMDLGPVGQRAQCLRGREGRQEKPALKGGIIQVGRYWPGNADHRCPAQVLGDRIAADPDGLGDQAIGLTADMLEAENLSNLSHGQSLCWHGTPRQLLGETLLKVDDCPCTLVTRPGLRVAGLPRNGWLVSVGIGGWNGSESPAALPRNTQHDPLESVAHPILLARQWCAIVVVSARR